VLDLRYAFLAGVASLLLLAGCSPFPGQSGAARNSGGGTSQASQPPAPTSQAGAAAEPSAADPGNQGGENKPAGYTDARYHYSLTGPGPLTARPDGTASFAGEDEQLVVSVVEGSRAADPAALAQADLNSLRSSTADFRLLSAPVAVTLGGQRVVRFTYSWTGRSSTGRQTTFTGARYYISKNEAMLAVISYRDASSEFSASEADGFAASFRWL
jgi:hypothetical protein